MERTLNGLPKDGHFAGIFAFCMIFACQFLVSTNANAEFSGGFLELPDTAQIRARYSDTEIQSFLPNRGEFTFPAPYNTEAIRITNSSDCGGGDCAWPVGYSYWRNINNHQNSDTMYIFLGLDRNRGGTGPTLFSYNKTSGQVTNQGPLFDATNSALGWHSGEGWYFSASQSTKLYVNDGPRMIRFDVLSKSMQTVFDVTSEFGSDKYIWQMHSSDNDLVHSATLRSLTNYEMLGCVVYYEKTKQFDYFPKIGSFDECHVDKSGRWLMSLEDTDYQYGLEMRIFDLANNGAERLVWDQDGAVGHADLGYGYIVGTDNWNNLPNAILNWDLQNNQLGGSVVFHNRDWFNPASNHISHTNARPGIPASEQYACGSHASSNDSPWANEVVCFRLDGSLNTLVVAPVMTDMNSSVGGDSYSKAPKGNLDVTGQYFIWTSNTGGNRVDAFIAKVPSHLLVDGNSSGGGGTGGDTGGGTGSGGVIQPDITPPAVTINSPIDGSLVSGTITIAANASDDIGVAGVMFQLDGINLGSEDTSAPYSISWNTASTVGGAHTLTAVARDAAGNTTVSSPILVSTSGNTGLPNISDINVSDISGTSARINWTTSVDGDSQAEYGNSTGYGHETLLSSGMTTSHSVALTGLTPDTTYHYRVKSRNVNGDLEISADATFKTDSAWSSAIQNVTWTNVTNLTVDGNSIQKTSGCDGCVDAGAISQQKIVAQDGYVEFTVTENTLVRYIGLNDNANGTDYRAIPFSFKIVSGYAEVREYGQYRSDKPVTLGDVLRIELKSNVVEYSKNGIVFYTSNQSPKYPLCVDAVISSMNASIDNVVISGTSGTSGNQPDVIWESITNVSVDGSSIQKTGGCDGCNDAGAVSQQKIVSGDGFMEFTVANNDLLFFIGLNDGTSVTDYQALPYSFKIVSGYAEAREYGNYRSDVPVVAGDILRIAINSGNIEYSKNGSVFYSRKGFANYPVRANAVMVNINAKVDNVKIVDVTGSWPIRQPDESGATTASSSTESPQSGGAGTFDPVLLILLYLLAVSAKRQRKSNKKKFRHNYNKTV